MPAQAPTHALRLKRQRERNEHRRHDQRRPEPVLRAEHDAGRRHARDEHEQPGVGHVVPERALDPLPEVVEVEDAVLDDAVDRAQRAGRDHDVDGLQRPLAAEQAVGDRDDRKEQELLGVEEADPAIDREEPRRPASRRRKRAAARTSRAPRCARVRGSTMTSQSTAASASRSSAAKIENSGAPAKRQQEQDRPLARRPEVSAVLAARSRCGPGQQALGRCDNGLRQQSRQASKIARRAHTLIARTAGESVDVDGRRRDSRIPPRRRSFGQRRTVDPDHRRRGRRGHMQRSCVAADEQPAALDRPPAARPGPIRHSPRYETPRRRRAAAAPRQRFARWPRDRTARS